MTNHNLQKIANKGSFDPTQFRGVTDNAGGVFGMAKREVTEFDLKLVYKHQQAQQLKNSQIPTIAGATANMMEPNVSSIKGSAAVRLVHASNSTSFGTDHG